MQEFSIMPDNPPYWRNFRFNGSERHEVFEGRTGNRNKSIKDGLVIFTTPELHRTGRNSIHMNYDNEIWQEMRIIAEKTWCKYYGKTIEEFIMKYGRNYI